jgi:hypothetical protein
MDALKVLPFVMAIIGAAVSPAFAQTSPQDPGTPPPQAVNSLSFEVRSVASGGGADNTKGGGSSSRGSTVSQTKTRTSQTTLELKVRNLSRTPVSAEFECYFVASAVGGRKYIASKGSKSMTVDPGQEQKEYFESIPIEQTSSRSTTTTNTGGSTRMTVSSAKSGARPAGWFVRLMSEDKVIRVVASSVEYDKVARDPALLADLQRRAR